jgi:hypothetical protein
MTNMINEIISNVMLSSSNCYKFSEYDGISSRTFLLKGFDKKKLIYIKDVKPLRNTIPSSGLALTLVKNLDEYQYIACNYIPQLNDDNIFKIKFQKIRILIILFFYRLSQILIEKNVSDILDTWIKEATSLLTEISQLVLEFRENKKSITNNLNSDHFEIKNIKLKKDYYSFFKLDEKMIDKELFSIYGINI